MTLYTEEQARTLKGILIVRTSVAATIYILLFLLLLIAVDQSDFELAAAYTLALTFFFSYRSAQADFETMTEIANRLAGLAGSPTP